MRYRENWFFGNCIRFSVFSTIKACDYFAQDIAKKKVVFKFSQPFATIDGVILFLQWGKGDKIVFFTLVSISLCFPCCSQSTWLICSGHHFLFYDLLPRELCEWGRIKDRKYPMGLLLGGVVRWWGKDRSPICHHEVEQLHFPPKENFSIRILREYSPSQKKLPALIFFWVSSSLDFNICFVSSHNYLICRPG